MADGGAGQGLPSSNRGVSEFSEGTGISVGLDWVAFSCDLFAVAREFGIEAEGGESLSAISTDPQVAAMFAAHVFAFFFAGTGLGLSMEVKGGRFYKWRVPILDGEDFAGVIELGGESTIRKGGIVTARVELTGDGCRRFAAGSGHAKRWLELRAKLESCDGRLTRIDICADDLQGNFPVRLAQQWWEAGEFNARGQKPKARLYDDFNSGDGKTLYVGSTSSEKQLRVYEKGRELGDPASEWVRYEGQFRASSRKELPLDMLRDPAAYLRGAYPILAFIDAIAERIEVTKAAAVSTWKSVRRHLKRQYGAVFNFIALSTPDDEALGRVIKSLIRHRLPEWTSAAAANAWPEILAANNPEQFACT